MNEYLTICDCLLCCTLLASLGQRSRLGIVARYGMGGKEEAGGRELHFLSTEWISLSMHLARRGL